MQRNGHLSAPVLGEIVEASTTRFVAQCPPERLHAPPAFGTFVKVLPSGTDAMRAGEASGKKADRFDDPFADPPAAAPSALPPGTPEGALYALVFRASTGSAEPGRRPAAYGLDEDALRQEQPQIFDLLA